MAIYLKKFENHTQYENYINGSGAILPNVSICTTEGDVHYNPYVEPIETRVVAKFNVTDTSSPTSIGYNRYTSGFTAIEIDGVVQPSVVSAYTFTTGEHTVKYTLADPTSIGDFAFYGCSGLTSIEIPSGVTSIGNSAFANCSSLPVENSIRYADTYAVEAVDKTLSTYTIKSGTKWIGNQAFRDCSGLTSIDIPSGVTSIGNWAFYNCSSLTSIDIPSGVTIIDNMTFYNCRSLTSINIPSGVTSIGQSAFYQCSGLTSIDIPSGVTRIGNMAFYNCSGLTGITVRRETPPYLVQTCDDDDCWYDNFGSTNNCPIYVPSASVETYKSKSGWSSYASRIQAIS